MAAQAPARSIANAQLLPQGKVVHTALVKIAQGLGITVELLLIERYSLLQHSGRVDGGGGKSTWLLLEVAQGFQEGQMAGQLDKANEVPAQAAAMTVEKIFAGVDIERRPSFLVQGTESDELGVVTRGLCDPVLLL